MKEELEVIKIAEYLLEKSRNALTYEQALNVAARVQLTKVLKEAFVVGVKDTPSAFEKIAMVLENK